MIVQKLINKVKNISEKDRIVYFNALGAFAVKGAALVVSLFTMPAYMGFFADQQILGVWFTILSVLTWILNFDLGIGNGLRNRLTTALAHGDRQAAKGYISSAYWMIGFVVAVLSLIGWVLIPYINWNSVFNITTALVPASSLCEVVRFVYIGIMLQFFLRLISSILYALQRSAINNLIALSTSVLQLTVALLAPSLSPVENLKIFSVAYIFCANLPLVVSSVVVFRGEMRDCAPSFDSIQVNMTRDVLSLGGIFFLCQVLYMVIANTNEFFISQYTSPECVVEYQVYNRLFTLGSTLFMLALTPVWSAVSRAIAEKDYIWLKRLNKRLTVLSLMATIVEFSIIPFLQFIVNFWLGDVAIKINYSYACCFALFGSAMIFQSAVSTMVNGMGRMKIQAACYAVGIVFKFLFVHFGILTTQSWIVVVLANALILIPYCIIQQLDTTRYICKQITK